MTIVSSTFQLSGRVSRAYADSPTHSCGSGRGQAKGLNRTEYTVLTLGPWNSAVGPVTPGVSVSSCHLKIDLSHYLTAHPVNNQDDLTTETTFLHCCVMCKLSAISYVRKIKLFTSWILLVPFSRITSSKVFTLAGRILMFLKASNTPHKISMESFSWHHVWQIQTNTWKVRGMCSVSRFPSRSSILCWIKNTFKCNFTQQG